MAFPPVAVFIGGQMLEGYTNLSITRSKEELTGSAVVDLFFGYMPSEPVMVDAAVGKEFLVYIGGALAFNGTLDRRTGMGAHRARDSKGRFTSGQSAAESGGSRSANIGPNDYTVQLTARGKTKKLIESSHQVKKNLVKTNTKEALEKLVEPFDVQVEFIGTQVDLDKVRFRDGSIVLDEIRRIETENCYYIYETREGKLRVTDDIGPGQGESLVLGTNILGFSASQSEVDAQQEIIVKGQRTEKEMWGEAAVLQETISQTKDNTIQGYSSRIVQHYGNAKRENLERRARFEMNKQSSKSKSVTVEVFHVQPTSGEPWDIGTLHYVEVPPEGIFNTMECTGIQYLVQNDKTLKTTLTLSPPPSGESGGAKGLDSFEGLDNQPMIGTSQKAALGVTFAPGTYPAPWTGPQLVQLAEPLSATILAALSGVSGLEKVALGDQPNTPPLKLPVTFDT